MKENSINLILSLPPSVNICYSGMQRRHKSEKYKQWVKECEIELLSQTRYNIKWDKWLLVSYQYHMPLHYKNWKKKVIDVANYEKVLTDTLCKNIPGFEDHKIKKMFLEKIESEERFVKIKIKEI